MQIAEDFTGTNAPSYPLMVAERVRALRADRDARAMLAAESRDDTPLDAGTLAEILARPAEPAARVDGLIPWEASTLLVAQRKVGKTTMMLNLARCLLTGEPFLGSHNVRKLSAGSRVGLLNFEVSGAQLARWARDAGVPADRLFLVNLRGRRNPLAHPDDREQLAHVLRGQCVESLLTDPFGRAYSGASQNDAGEVYGWLATNANPTAGPHTQANATPNTPAKKPAPSAAPSSHANPTADTAATQQPKPTTSCP